MKKNYTHYPFSVLRRFTVIFVLLFAIWGAGSGQALQKIEYFFDKDPGIGNGVAIPVSAKGILDTSLRLPVIQLSAGLHTVYVRAKDTSGVWGLAWSASFIRNEGSDSVLHVGAVEYFFDTDPGYGNGTPLPITPGADISNLFNVQVPDNGRDSRMLYIRARDSYGRWSLLYYVPVDLCRLYKARPAFGFIRYGATYSFIDSTINNPSGKLTWRFDNGNTDTIVNPIQVLGIGRHSVKLVAGSGCRADSVTRPLYTALESYAPRSAMTGGDITMDFYGGGFDTNTIVTLIDPSGKSISAVERHAASNNGRLLARFDLSNVQQTAAAKWDIRLQFPGAAYDTLIREGLAVLPRPADSTQGEPRIGVTISMPPLTGANTWHRGSYTVANNGLVSVKMVPFSFSVDDQLQDFRLTNMSVASAGDTAVYNKTIQNGFNNYDHLNILFGQRIPSRVYSMILPEIGPGQTITLNFEFLTPLTLQSQVHAYAWTGHRMLGSSLRQDWADCLTYVTGYMSAKLSYLSFSQSQAAAKIVSCGTAVVSGIYQPLQLTNSIHDIESRKQSERNWDMGGFAKTIGTVAMDCIGIRQLDETQDFKNLVQFGVMTDKLTGGTQADKELLSYSAASNPCLQLWNEPVHATLRSLASMDPNEIIGPAGPDSTRHYINASTQLSYRINFENMASAPRAAQHVRIIDTLHVVKADIGSFQLQGLVIGDSTYGIPPFRNEYTATIDMRASRSVLVRFNAKLDTLSQVLTADFWSVDPVSGQLITDTTLKGFLPPNTDGKSGTGALIFSLAQKAGNRTGDSISQHAAIVFDNNAPILTNTWLNVIDDTQPDGKISGAVLRSDTSFSLRFNGSDAESGMRSYQVYASVNKQPWFLYVKDVRDSLRISASKDSTYDFYAVAVDEVNNIQQKTATPDITVTLFQPAPITGDSVVCSGAAMTLSNTTAGGSWSIDDTAVATISSTGVLQGLKAGTVIVNYTVKKDYFTRSVSKTIRVKPAPAKISFTGTQRSFCDRDSLVMGVSGLQAKDSLFWFTGTVIDSSQRASKTFRDSAIFTVLRKDSSGCGTFSDTVKLVRIIVPVPTITQQNDTLISSAPTGNQWYLNNNLINGATGSRYRIHNSGTYRVSASDTSGCRSALSAVFNVTITAISNTVINSRDWQVFPSPVTTGMLYIRRTALLNGTVKGEIVSDYGSVLAQRQLGHSTQWNLSYLAAGTYTLRIIEKQSVAIYRFIKL